MVNRKRKLLEEIGKYSRSFIVIAISLMLIAKNVSFGGIINLSENVRVIWAIDMAIYTLIINICLSIAMYYFNLRRLDLEVVIKNVDDDIDEMKIGEDPRTIKMSIKIKGPYKKLPAKLYVSFPSWIDPQSKSIYFMEFNEEKNTYKIDIEQLIPQKRDFISLERSITFNIASNDDEKNTDYVIAQLDVSRWKKFFTIDFFNNGINITRK
ncbi:hypothetical protein [Cytobacillus horneckiae]|uniref:Uncharacterized protein n=1 Tax=Cytobacillus horneckiae TaxID=549687 RepID=A0A2N0ZMV4_9BACI|nr:hypothetical protein [Cytobacillus horneckiae]MED2940639.1 hypothetical protein [Cytobacillus horneckiae]PKG30840.1 hypothetical protein CWS20_01080 [Cytobacillus horneckiae]